MKTKLLIAFLCVSLSFYAQEKYYTKSGTITFESSVPSFEEVKATNTKVSAILKDDGTIASLALVKAFRFKIALMEEHFNENYAESNQFPKAKFSGKIENFNLQDLNASDTKVTIKGKLTFHGVTKEIIVPATISKKDTSIFLNASLSLKPEDFGIKIPKIVRKKIAERVDVNLNFQLNKR